MENMRSVIYDKNVLEFVTVGVQFCAFLEQNRFPKRKDFIDTLLKILPLLYLKALLLPPLDDGQECFSEEFVTEQDYETVRMQIAALLGEQDAYLDLDLRNLQMVQEPQLKTVSEDVADVYQAVRNFVTTYKLEIEQSMYEALEVVKEQFDLYWGQTLLNALRALHGVETSLEQEGDFSEDDDFLD